jgi:transcriptional regulator with XRE-family HTH domain
MNYREAKTAGEFIRLLRLSKLMTQGALSKKSGKAVSFWSAIENGKSVPMSIVDFVVDEFGLNQADADQLKTLAIESKRQQRLDLTSIHDPEAKDLAIAFAKHLEHLNHDQIEAIKSILNKAE